jgi:hypothetical protein
VGFLRRATAPLPSALLAIAAVGISGLGDPLASLHRAGLAAGGLGAAAVASLVWRERTALMHPTLRWLGGAALLLVALLAPLQFWLPVAAAVAGLLLWNDQSTGPGMLLALGAAAAVSGHALDWEQAGFREAWWFAAAGVVACAAALVERERLASPRLHPVPPAWTAVRVIAIAAWTFAVLVVFAAVKDTDPSAALGFEVYSLSGQVVLLAILVAATIALALAFTRRPKEPKPGPTAEAQAAPSEVREG